MADGNFLSPFGLDLQLLTAGSAGGLVKAIFDKSRIVDAIGTTLAGALTSNYFATPAVQITASGAMFGVKLEIGQGVAGFFVGMFAVLIVGWLFAKLRSKLQGDNDGKAGKPSD